MKRTHFNLVLIATLVSVGIGLAFAPQGLTPREAALGALVWAVGLWLVGRAGTVYIRLTNPARFEEMGVDSALGFGDVKMMGLVGAFMEARRA